jgi:hypothetical protein
MRAKTVRNIYDKKFKLFEFDGVWQDVFGLPEKNGFWLIWGSEKHGKTTFALLLANYLSKNEKIFYISAEEGLGDTFVSACRRVKISQSNRNFLFEEYITIEELEERLSKRKSPDVIVIDNTTIYSDELRTTELRRLLHQYSNKLFIFLAHEDRGEPYKITAKIVSKLAKVLVYVEGMTCRVSGRVPGGVIRIDETKSIIYHGYEES